MNNPELELLDIEALLESSALLADELRRSGADDAGAAVDELCRRLRAAKAAFVVIHDCVANFGINLY